MKKMIFLLLAGFSLSNAFEVHKSNEFTKEIEPNVMSTSIAASVEDKSKAQIQKIFKKAIEESKSENICTNGSYRISPNYRYVEQKRLFLGYRGDIVFECEFEDTKKFDTVISKLDKASNEKDKLKLTINPIQWIVDKKRRKQIKDELELEALYYAKNYKSFLSNVYAKECAIKEVSLNTSQRFVDQERVYMMQSDAKSRTTAPIKKNHTIGYNASYKFECN